MSDNKSISSNLPGSDSIIEKPAPFVDAGAPLPDGYGDTRAALLPRDPRWMYTYWEISEHTAREIKSQHGEDIFLKSQGTVRMHEVASRNGALQSIRTIDISVSLDARNWYLHSDKEGASWFVEIGLKTPDGRFIAIVKSNPVTLPTGTVSEIVDEKWVSVKDDLEKVLEASGGGKMGMGSLELARMLAQRWELLNEISSWKGSGGVSSFGRPTEEQKARSGQRSFWLQADCELILYGATEPTATLTVAGKPVELSPDGTFSLRFAFPDGQMELPVKAISGDQVEERWIKITVERRTERSS